MVYELTWGFEMDFRFFWGIWYLDFWNDWILGVLMFLIWFLGLDEMIFLKWIFGMDFWFLRDFNIWIFGIIGFVGFSLLGWDF